MCVSTLPCSARLWCDVNKRQVPDYWLACKLAPQCPGLVLRPLEERERGREEKEEENVCV